MPEISKINALAIGSVAKVDGLAKASILDIDGVTVPSDVSPPLDTYTNATAGYSVRLIRTAYKTGGGTIMRVRRASDNVEADVGFDSNDEFGLTSPISNTSDAQSYTDFADFVDHTGTPTNAFVRYWYDQSGNAEDASESTASRQPQIYNGSIFSRGTPARPEIRATTNGRMVLGTLAHDVDRKYFGAVTASVSSFCVLFGSNSTSDYELLAQSGDTQSIFDGGGAIVNRNGSLWYDAPTLDKTRDDVWTDFSSQSIVMLDHVLATVTGRTTQLGYATNGIPMFHMQELIIYPTGTSHAVSDIENAINAYYEVY